MKTKNNQKEELFTLTEVKTYPVKTIEENSLDKIVEQIQYKEYNGFPVITFDDIAKVHQIPRRSVESAYNRTSDKMNSSIDTFILKGNDVKVFMNNTHSNQMSASYPSMLRIFTESGYLNIIKAMDDEVSWKVFQKLKDCYFNVKNKVEEKTEQQLTDDEMIEKSFMILKERNEAYRKQIAEKDKTIVVQQKQIEKDKPKVEFFDAVATAPNWSSLAKFTKTKIEKGLGPRKIFHYLVFKKVLMKKGKEYEPYYCYTIEPKKYFRLIEKKYDKKDQKDCVSHKVMISPSGESFILELIKEDKQKHGNFKFLVKKRK